MTGHFLAGIAALIWDPAAGQYLLLRRAAARDYGAGNWECVTGRVDQGESFEQALHREVREETGAAVRIDWLLGTSHLYRGEAVPENELLGIVCLCSLTSPRPLTPSAEHDEQRWATAAEALTLLDPERPAEAWLAGILRRAEIARGRIDSELRAFYWFNGIDTD